jgi:hypothetical protein
VIDNDRFEILHERFCDYMLEKGGVPFTSFRHEFLFTDEIRYKWEIFHKAHATMELATWRAKDTGTGSIVTSFQRACSPNISKNLLEHKYGEEKGSYKSLYLARGKQRSELEEQLYNCLVGGDSSRESFGPRFDALANFLRENHLGANWEFMAYIAFLRDPWRYFPIRSTKFQELLTYFGVQAAVSGKATWERYSVLLDLADHLRDRLAIYSPMTAIDLQSYMWVSAYLIADLPKSRKPRPRTVDMASELMRRQQIAANRERVGLAGEMFVLDRERERLTASGRRDLASRVELIAVSGNGRGYDIRSFDEDGKETLIEVKTTASTPAADAGFWLSEGERLVGESNPRWCVHRVWSIDTEPRVENLGNIVRNGGSWMLTPASWAVRAQETS